MKGSCVSVKVPYSITPVEMKKIVQPIRRPKISFAPWIKSLIYSVVQLTFLFTFLTVMASFFSKYDDTPYYNKLRIKHLENLNDATQNLGEKMEDVIVNIDKFRRIESNSLVVVVQVSDNVENFKRFITILERAERINDILLILSYDYLNLEIDAIVRNISSCTVLQIFYPHSIRFYPKKFPGEDSNDCPPNISREDAILRGCQNSFYQDIKGKYRNANLTQGKHRWWWTANKVFNMNILENYDGLFIFLDDDHYVAKDFIYAMTEMRKLANRVCEDCHFFALSPDLEASRGDRKKLANISKVTVRKNISNTGLAFTRATWNKIVSCKESFCRADDKNWDVSLQNVISQCINKSLTMVSTFPRIFRLADCGENFYTSDDCDTTWSIKLALNKIFANCKFSRYPSCMILGDWRDEKPSYKIEGGWGDPRDHSFCLGMAIH